MFIAMLSLCTTILYYPCHGHIQLTEEFVKDLNWFNTFLYSYNGVPFYENKPVQAVIELDASLTGLGAIFQKHDLCPTPTP